LSHKEAYPSIETMNSLSKTKVWIFRLGLIFGAPLIFFILLETSLRFIGYGHPTTLFLEQGNGTLGTNSKFTWRFFDPKIARIPEAINVARQKPANTKRIFVLGGSAALGVPHSAYSFSRVLEVLLDNAYPEQEFEVYNVAMTAINSHVVLPIARECAELDPDLFIVYMGNNEVVGPYGPGSVIQGFQPNLSIIRLSVWAKTTRTGQWLSEIIGTFGKDTSAPKQWTGMDIFVDKVVSASDPRLNNVYSHLQSNLDDIIKIGRKAGARVMVSTVASNIQDSFPFASSHSNSLSEMDRQNWTSTFEEVQKKIAEHNYSDALALIEECELLDKEHALLTYEKAHCYENIGQVKQAREAYINARNLDALRFRTDSSINEKIRETVQDFSDEGVQLIDAEQLFGGTSESTHSIAGYDEFFEHVHLTFEGNYKLAKAIFHKLPAVIPDLAETEKTNPPNLQACVEQLAWNSWGKIKQLNGIIPLIDRPPFTGQKDHAQRMQDLNKELMQHNADIGKDNGHRTLQNFKTALEKRPDDPSLHQLIGEFYYSMNQHDEALKHLQIVNRILPSSHDAFMHLAYIYFQSGRVEESVPHFRRAIELSPHYVQTQVDLASALAHLKHFDEAEAICERLSKELPDDPTLQFGYGYVLFQAEKLDAAEQQLIKTFTLDPGAFHLRQLVDSKLIAAGKSDTVRAFDKLFLEAQSYKDNAYAQLVEYYVSLKDFDSAKYYQLEREELGARR
jgi:tetratricopeptide (TPR) repeat protein